METNSPGVVGPENTNTDSRPRGRGDGRARGRSGGRSGRGQRGGSRGQFRGGRHTERPNHEEAKGPVQAKGNTETDETAPTQSTQHQSAAQSDGADDVEADVCFICANPVVHNSVAPCNHRTCHICALRLRALYQTKACAHCRTNADFVIFTDDPARRFEDFTADSFAKTDTNFGIHYEKSDICEDTELLLRFNCPEASCDIACYSWKDLQRHVRNAHHRVMCDLCIHNKKVFSHEHSLFTHPQLRQHMRHGDDSPGAVDQSGFKGHPECGFCRIRYYGDDELYTHCRDAHERCHICDRRRTSTSTKPQYFLDYDALETHFGKDHFLCLDRECLEQKFVVFESEMDLKAHQLEKHPHGLSKDARRDARRVDMAGFPEYRAERPRETAAANAGWRDARQDRGRGRGAGRGRDPNANANDPIPVSSAQPMRRDELAYQRTLAIHSAAVTGGVRTFGGNLSSATAAPSGQVARPTSASGPPTTTTTTSKPEPEVSAPQQTIDPSRPTSPRTRARQVRHAAVTERASNLLGASQDGLTTFRSNISNYFSSKITAAQLVESFFDLFNCSTAELGTLIREVSELFEAEGKKESLLSAWNDWRALNEGFPMLGDDVPGTSLGTNAHANTTGGGKRILKLKSSTVQNTQSAAAVKKQGTWGGVLAGTATTVNAPSGRRIGAGAGTIEAFPSLSSRSGSNANRAGPAWASSLAMRPAVATNSPTRSPVIAPVASRQPARRPANDSMSFPALPAAQKLEMNVSRPGFAGTPSRRPGVNTNAGVNAWTNGFNARAAAVDDEGAAEDGDASAGGTGKKGKGKKKQTLIHWG